jgi:predicted PurR-regulated permease PerM
MAKKQSRKKDEGGNAGFLAVLSIGALLGALVPFFIKIVRGSRPTLMGTTVSSHAPGLPVISGQTPAPIQEVPAPFANSTAGVANQSTGGVTTLGTRRTTNWSTGTKFAVGIFMVLAILGTIYMVRGILPIIIFATLVAFIVQPIIDYFLRRFKFKKGPAVIVTYLLVLLVLTLLPLIVVPAAIDAINAVVKINYLSYIQSTAEWINQTALGVKNNPILNMVFGPLLLSVSNLINSASAIEGTVQEPVVQLSMQTIGNGIASALGLLANVLGPVVSAVLTLVFTLLISVQISFAKDDFVNWYPTIIPEPYQDEFLGLAKEINKIWNSFLRGQLTLMVIIGVVTWGGNLILGTPQALFLAIVAGLLEIIPSVGPFLATIPAVILALMFGSSYLPVSNFIFALIVIGLYVLIQALENNLIVPRVMGDAMDLSPVIVLIACLAGGAAFGILGVFLATPVVATVRMLFGYFYKKILESPPLEPEKPEKPSFWDNLGNYFNNLRLFNGNKNASMPSSPNEPETTKKMDAEAK